MDLGDVIKNELLLVGLLVILVGLLFTDAYYDAFGIRYQSLDLPSSYFVFRGITAVVHAPWILLPYVACIVVLSFQAKCSSGRLTRSKLQVYASIPIIVALAGWMAGQAGDRQAARDMSKHETTLPRVDKLEVVDSQVAASLRTLEPRRLRLLFAGATFAIVFAENDEQASAENASRPHLFWVNNAKISALRTNSSRQRSARESSFGRHERPR